MKTWNKIAACFLTATITFTAFPVHAFAQEGKQAPTEQSKNLNVCLKVGDEQEYCNRKFADAIKTIKEKYLGIPTQIRLQSNVEGTGIVIPSGAKITIDFGGYSYTVTKAPVGSSGTETLGFQLLEGSTVTLKNGTITSANPNVHMLVQNYSERLALDGMTIDGSNLGLESGAYTLSNNNGYTKIHNSTIIAKEGGYAFDLYYWPKNGYGQVTVDVTGNSLIDGNIEYGGDSSTTAETIYGAANLRIKDGEIKGILNVDSKFTGSETKANIQITGGTFTDIASVKEYVNERYQFDENHKVIIDKEYDNGYIQLLQAIEAAKKQTDDAAYSEESRRNLKNVIDYVSVYANKDASKAEVANASSVLKTAVDCLVTVNIPVEDNKAELAALKTMIEIGNSLAEKEQQYEAEGFASFTAALQHAKEIAALGAEATKEEIASAKEALLTAIEDLKPIQEPSVEVLDKTALYTQIEKAEAYLNNGKTYSDASLAALRAAIASAKRAAEIEDLDILVMQEVIERLKAACEGLEEVSVPSHKPTPTPDVIPAAPDSSDSIIKHTASVDGNMALITLSALAGACAFAASKKREEKDA